jgi:hypothetical protein
VELTGDVVATLRFESDPDELARAVIGSSRPVRRKLRKLLILAAILIVAVVVVLAVVLVLCSPPVLRWSAMRVYRKNPTFQGAIVQQVHRDGLHHETDTTEDSLHWRTFESFTDTGEGILLPMLGGHTMMWMPKRGGSAEDWAQVVHVVGRNLEPTPKKTPKKPKT